MKRFLSLLLALTLLCTMLPAVTMRADAVALSQSQFDAKLSSARAVYPTGAQREEWSINGTIVGWQCHGYGRWLSWYVWGVDFANGNGTGWTLLKSSSSSSYINSLVPGDVVRFRRISSSGVLRTWNHTIFITNIIGDTIYYTDCNSDGACTVMWEQQVSKSTLDSWLKLPLYGSEAATYGYIAHYTPNTLKADGEHTCNKDTYVYYEAAHPHYKCYKCSVCGSVWRNTAEPTKVSSCTTCVPTRVVDSKYSAYFPIAAYPISTGKITVYDESGTAYSNRYITGSTDLCIIWEIYTDGWCKVRYPSSSESSGYFDAYVPLTVFTSSTSPTSWVAASDYTTYKRSDIGTTMYNISSGAKGLLLKTDGYLKQIIHPVSGQSYYMMGWIAEPKQIHVSYNSAGIILGDRDAQNIDVWTTGYYNGTTSLFFKKSNENVSCSWGEWENGKAPLTITGKSEGTTTLTVGVMVKETGEVLDSTTIEVVIGVTTYTISYNANGGTGAPTSQTKKHGTALTLSTTKPTRTGYTFLGWAKSSTATSADCQPGDMFTANGDITLYAVWKKGCENSSHKYSYTLQTAPSATAVGKLAGTCGRCGATTAISLPKLNNTDYSYKVTKAPTCTATGVGRYTWKNTSYGSFYFDVSISKAGHSYAAKVTAPSCTAQGYTTHTCSACSNSYKDSYIKALGHNYSNGSCTRCSESDPDYVVNQKAPQIVLESKKVTKGKEFTVTVEVKNNPGFSYLEMTPVLSPELTLVKVENGELISDFTKGKQYVWVSDEDVTQDGKMLTFTFSINDSVESGNCQVSFNIRTCANYAEELLEFAVVKADIEVLECVYGDATGDGTIDGLDVIRLKKYLANYDYDSESSTIEASLGADANGDGKIDGLDVIRLKKYLANYDYGTGESTIVLGPQ